MVRPEISQPLSCFRGGPWSGEVVLAKALLGTCGVYPRFGELRGYGDQTSLRVYRKEARTLVLRAKEPQSGVGMGVGCGYRFLTQGKAPHRPGDGWMGKGPVV